jgi:hypothetical protein
MTPAELQILKAISGRDVSHFLPAGKTAAQARAFDELVETLQGMQRLRWIELEVAPKPGRIGSYLRKYAAAAARCTEQGRQALRLLGE